jgi:hypothetical protein
MDNAGDGRAGEDGQPLLPSSTGGILCSSNGPLRNPQSEALLIKNKPTTKHHKTKETRNRELIDERACSGVLLDMTLRPYREPTFPNCRFQPMESIATLFKIKTKELDRLGKLATRPFHRAKNILDCGTSWCRSRGLNHQLGFLTRK